VPRRRLHSLGLMRYANEGPRWEGDSHFSVYERYRLWVLKKSVIGMSFWLRLSSILKLSILQRKNGSAHFEFSNCCCRPSEIL